MLLALVASAVSFVMTLLVIKLAGRVGARLNDHGHGPQKFHALAVARVGGVGIVIGLATATAVGWAMAVGDPPLGATLLVAGIPAFVGGLLEDLTKRVSPAKRLLATAVSALLAVAFLGAAVTRTDIPGLDWIVGSAFGATLVTVIAVAGIANSVNIIDGFNGLASMCVMIMLAAIAYVAFQVGDSVIGTLALAGIGAVLGFFVWNFPNGLIFLGDGGAYFLGFFVAELAILLLVRNPTVSPIFPLLVCIYPIFETLFSIYRRRFLKAVNPGMPDGIHLHSLIYRRMMRWAVGDRSAKALTRRNSMTSPFLWLLCMLSVVPAVLFWDNSAVLGAALVLFMVTYVVLYWRIVRFKSPRWMRVLAGNSAPMPLGPPRDNPGA